MAFPRLKSGFDSRRALQYLEGFFFREELLLGDFSSTNPFVKSYLFVLGRNPILSRTELKNFCDEILYDENKSLLLAENLKFENPRNLPKTPEQLFLDRLGGTIRFGEVIGEYRSENELIASMLQKVQEDKPEGKVNLGISAWGCGRDFLKHFLPETKNAFRDQLNRNCRIVNAPGENLDSGKIFGEKLLRNGFEFLVWRRSEPGFKDVPNPGSYLLAKTVANQNLRNYTLRDREKDFRDARMGMMPPKLAQIMMNLANPRWDEVVIDPFCGSGTLNIEAAITGFQTIGSDLEEKHVFEARQNFEQMSEKFRYEKMSGEFFGCDATKFPLEKASGVIVTEGFLGNVFEKYATPQKIEQEGDLIVRLWEKIISHFEKSTVRTICFCLPIWKYRGRDFYISEKLFAKIGQSSYIPSALFEGKYTFLYARPDSFVQREICVLQRK